MNIDDCTEVLEDLLEDRSPRVRILWSHRALKLAEQADDAFDERTTEVWVIKERRRT
jgi:hypothetical protein